MSRKREKEAVKEDCKLTFTRVESPSFSTVRQQGGGTRQSFTPSDLKAAKYPHLSFPAEIYLCTPFSYPAELSTTQKNYA